MKKILIFLFIGLLSYSCAEKEDPETIYGNYFPESITSDKTIDITGNGIVSLDLLDQLVNSTSSIFSGQNSGIIFLTLYSPEYFNLHYSQVLLRLPHQLNFNDKVTLEYYQTGRRMDLEDNGSVALSWNTFPYPFKFPEQIHEDIIIESFKINTNVELVTSQKLFDHSKNDWVEAKISYTFRKDNR